MGAAAGGIPSGPMPLLTLRGFIDLTTVETLFDPSKGWDYLNRALRYYQLPLLRSWGEIPRWALPGMAPREILDRVANIQQTATQQAMQSAQITAHANAAAVNAVSPYTRIEYRYH
jgi:hypothetical protein